MAAKSATYHICVFMIINSNLKILNWRKKSKLYGLFYAKLEYLAIYFVSKRFTLKS